jgi:hypothetical protein
MSTNTTDNVTLRKSISQVVNSALFRKIINGIIETEYQKMTANINQQLDQVISRLDTLDLSTPFNSITNQHLQDNSVTINKVVNDSITTEKLADSSITTDKLADSSVTTEKLDAKSVTNTKIATNSITSDNLNTNIIQTVHLLDNAITTSKLADSSITSEKLIEGIITSKYLATGSVSFTALSVDVTNAISNQTSNLTKLIGKVSNIENYLSILTSTYAIKDKNEVEITFTPTVT